MSDVTITLTEEASVEMREAIGRAGRRAFPDPRMPSSSEMFFNGAERLLSVLATEDHTLIGYALFSAVTIDGAPAGATGMGLAEIGVLPDRQRQGIGSRMIQAALERFRRDDVAFVATVASMYYLRRHGFIQGSERSLRCQWPSVPESAFLVLVMNEPTMEGVSGVVRFNGLP